MVILKYLLIKGYGINDVFDKTITRNYKIGFKFNRMSILLEVKIHLKKYSNICDYSYVFFTPENSVLKKLIVICIKNFQKLLNLTII